LESENAGEKIRERKEENETKRPVRLRQWEEVQGLLREVGARSLS